MKYSNTNKGTLNTSLQQYSQVKQHIFSIITNNKNDTTAALLTVR